MVDGSDMLVEAIRARVCSVCLHSDPSGVCSVDMRGTCAVERFLPQIVDVATTVTSDRIDDYVSALRDSVCHACRPDGDAQCSMRDSTICGLDRYFVLIIEAIEDVILKGGQSAPARSAMTPGG